jgi:hypothetical protein
MRIDSAHLPRKPFFRAARRTSPTPHVIRLRGPWRWEAKTSPGVASRGVSPPAAAASGAGQPGLTFTAPDGLSPILAHESVVRLCVSRTFHCPTGLNPRSQVDLVIEPLSAPCTVRLNSISLGSLGSGVNRFSIVQHLQQRNELQLELDLAAAEQPESTQPRIDVRLEII